MSQETLYTRLKKEYKDKLEGEVKSNLPTLYLLTVQSLKENDSVLDLTYSEISRLNDTIGDCVADFILFNTFDFFNERK